MSVESVDFKLDMEMKCDIGGWVKEENSGMRKQ